MLSNHNVSLLKTIMFVIGGTGLMIAEQSLEGPIENWARARFVRVTGIIQREFIKKASNIDLICYDQKKYFEDFVIAASQSDEMIINTVMCTAEMIGLVTGIVTVGALIFTINPIIAIFPIAGFLINMITRFRITELEYQYDMEYKRLMRKADYSKRVFYQPEYAKEIKLSNIETPLRMQFEGALTELEVSAKKIGVKIALLSLVNWISVFTILSNGCVPLYLGYLALVKRSIALGDVAAMNNAQGSIRNFLDGINYSFVQFQKVGQFAERFRRFMDYEIQIENNQGSRSLPKAKEVLEIKEISFCYEGAKEETLKYVSMTVKPHHLADFDKKLSRLPNGIQTQMTKEFAEEGTMLSGGETQKVSIARMFAKNNDISLAILDEPSSALDPLSEATLTKNMMDNAKEAAVIFISHRLSTTKEADHIYMFENGTIIEDGTHEELMKLNGKYAYMFEKQAHYYQDEIA